VSPLADALLQHLHGLMLEISLIPGEGEIEQLRRAVDVGRLTVLHRALEADDRVSFILARENALLDLYEQTGEISLLESAISFCRVRVTLYSGSEASEQVRACKTLAWALYTFWEANAMRHTDTVDEAIAVGQRLLESLPSDDPGRADACTRLAEALWGRYQLAHELPFLERIIKLEREVLKLRASTSTEEGASFANLCHSLHRWYAETGDTDILREATELGRQAVALCPRDDAARALCCSNAATALRMTFEASSEVEMLSEAIELDREALLMRPAGDPDRPLSCTGLGNSLWNQFQLNGNVDLLDEALMLHREALELQPQGHPLHAESCHNLGNTLSTLYQRNGEMQCLDEAIELARKTRQTLRGSLWLAELLPFCLWLRFEQTGDMNSLHEAINTSRDILRACPSAYFRRASLCGNLSNWLWALYGQNQDLLVLDEAIQLGREAVELSGTYHSEYPRFCSNLGTFLRDRFDRTHDSVTLDQALQSDENATRILDRSHSEYPRACNNLARSLIRFYRRTGDLVHLEEAYRQHHDAKDTSPVTEPERIFALCGLVKIHLTQGTPFYDPLAAIELLEDTLDITAHRQDRLVKTIIKAIAHIDIYELPQSQMLRLLHIFRVVITKYLPLLANFLVDPEWRLRALVVGNTLASAAFACAIRAEDPTSGVELLERTRDVFWLQALTLRDPEVRELPSEMASEIGRLFRAVSTASATLGVALEGKSRSALSNRDTLHRQHRELQQAITQAQAISGFERFMQGPSFAHIIHGLTDTTVVCLAADSRSGHALLVSSSLDGPVYIQLPGVNVESLRDFSLLIRNYDLRVRLSRQDENYRDDRGIRIDRDRRKIATPLEKVLASMWNLVVKPIIDRLGLKVSFDHPSHENTDTTSADGR
jgi:hypothetical protein